MGNTCNSSHSDAAVERRRRKKELQTLRDALGISRDRQRRMRRCRGYQPFAESARAMNSATGRREENQRRYDELYAADAEHSCDDFAEAPKDPEPVDAEPEEAERRYDSPVENTACRFETVVSRASWCLEDLPRVPSIGDLDECEAEEEDAPSPPVPRPGSILLRSESTRGSSSSSFGLRRGPHSSSVVFVESADTSSNSSLASTPVSDSLSAVSLPGTPQSMCLEGPAPLSLDQHSSGGLLTPSAISLKNNDVEESSLASNGSFFTVHSDRSLHVATEEKLGHTAQRAVRIRKKRANTMMYDEEDLYW